ncbi:MAG: chromosome segregation protein SMC [Ornithinimicrobium sp.]|uniref:chromosome segregation protein SMC n=1 Tax=Ornithinimicrobium sp. TaxID=1977084 RepID=UPI003D9BCBFA
MYVKSLTLKGFKSFASATTLRLEPGITCIVGSNGSGKSNVVDALAWVMGEQGAKSLRGGKMEDVIFAGTSGRPPLGRAEVSMTIDNTDGALPIDYSEVTITRTMFRSGGSDYAINGTSCRLLDVQELLSDSGIGREMHVIVGQGQLDQVLRATPEERRGFIEEAAGVLKHRKRKERALRKLESMEANLTRLADLTTEIRRQLGPLGRQAETARRASTIQAEVRDARARILADDLVQLSTTLEQELADETALIRRRTAVEDGLRAAQASVTQLEAEAAATAPRLARAQDRWYALTSLVERFRSTADLATERVRLLAQEAAEADEDSGSQRTGQDPEHLRSQAEQMREQERALLDQIETLAEALAQAEQARGEAEQAHGEEQTRLTRLARAAADRREGLARLAGQVSARRSRIEAGEAELGRLQAVAEAVLERAHEAERQFAALEATILDVEQGEEGLDRDYEQAEQARERAARTLSQGQERIRAAQTEQAGLQARCEALQMSLRRKDGAQALMDDGPARIVGTVTSVLSVEPGHEAGVAAALGWAGEALVARGLSEAGAALDWLRQHDEGQVALFVPGGPPAWDADTSSWGELPEYAVWAADVVSVTQEEGRAAARLLDRTALVSTAQQALALVRDPGLPSVVAVTAHGDVYGPGWVRGGSSSTPSPIEVQSAWDEASERLRHVTSEVEQATFEVQRADARLAEATEVAEARLDELHDSDARMAAVAEQLGQLGSTMRAARAERERTDLAIVEAQRSIQAGQAEMAELEQRLSVAEAEPARDADGEPDTAERDRLVAVAAAARSGETEARLALRTHEERVRAIGGRAESLEATARDELAARERAAQRRRRRVEESRVAVAVAVGAAYLIECTHKMATVAAAERDQAAAEQAEHGRGLAAARGRARDLGEELRELTDSVHRDEVARAEQRLRIEQLQTRATEELGMDPAVLVDEYGPHLLIPPVPGAPGAEDLDDLPEPAPFVREAQEKRLRAAERRLGALGKVNPLALEEFAALEERHTFLTEQVDDLRRSKADLLEIVKEVDERVQRVFAEAFEDTAAQFEGVFARLFPGGEGKLLLTDPDDMLTTGIEVEARPPGKKIKRLSLLSGGERSLTAVALLVAIFKARPSPFYIMDEVEAALDDTNLGRLLVLFAELRDSHQLIVITHQKRTMEVADALYGVSMQGDGVTTLVSQRLRDLQAEPASA